MASPAADPPARRRSVARRFVRRDRMKVPDNIAENLEQSQESVEPPHVAKAKDLTRVNKLSADLIAELAKVPDGDMVGEVISNALKLLRDQTNRGDIKL